MFQSKNLSVLGSNLLFKGLDETIINSIFNSKNFRAEKEGELIFQAGEESNYLYLILQGEVKLKYAGTKGSDASFRRVKNEFFGEKEVLKKTDRISSAVADKDSIFYLITKEELFNLIHLERRLLKNLLFNSNEDLIDTYNDSKEIIENQNPSDNEENKQGTAEKEIEEIIMDEELADYSFDNTAVEEIRDSLNENYLSYTDDVEENDDLNFNNNGFHPENTDMEKNEEKFPEELVAEHFQNEEFNNTLPVQNDAIFSTDITLNGEELIPVINDFDNIPEEPQKFELAEEKNLLGYEKFKENQPPETETLNLALSSLKFINGNISFPLSEIKQLAELLSKNSSLSEAQQINEIINKHINSLQSIIYSAFEFVQQKNNQILVRQKANIVLGNILSLLSKYVESKKVYLYKKMDIDAEIEVDEIKLYCCFFQLTKNACDSMPEGGNIFVSAVKEDDRVKIEFIDEGIGIPSSLLGEVFEPMVTHGKPDGAGLGLSVAKKIIRDHKGNISVDGELGEGTRIIVTLPVCEEEEKKV